mmetsp:Transcript_98618/g.181311  ORF Transcript_98618/g.181311 Transcript_98618/m.181311 type:complete len:86 (+) Transcript_98618:191-448(+)
MERVHVALEHAGERECIQPEHAEECTRTEQVHVVEEHEGERECIHPEEDHALGAEAPGMPKRMMTVDHQQSKMNRTIVPQRQSMR